MEARHFGRVAAVNVLVGHRAIVIIGPAVEGKRSQQTGIAWALAAIVLWGTLAAAVGDTLDGLAASTVVFWCLLFAAPTLIAFDALAMRRPLARAFVAPPRIVLLGVWGIFGYHAFLFEALDRAPMVEANLLNYLWPLLIVLLSPVTPIRPDMPCAMRS